MTPSKYLFLRIASRLGYSRKMLRLSHITSESHLLKEAETLLGEAIWRETENVKALSVEYWNLKKLVKDQNTISKEIDQLQEKINEKSGVFVTKEEYDSFQEAAEENLCLKTYLCLK